jgi:hypothetical protein
VSRDAGWLVRRGAQIGAVGLTIGLLHSDAGDLRIRCAGTRILAVAPKIQEQPEGRRNDSLSHESSILSEIDQQLAILDNPLIVTCGGRTNDLPLLRYRCFAHALPLGRLHLALGCRWKYFDRYDTGWHLDLGDLLSGHGASSELTLDDLCTLASVSFKTWSAGLDERASEESQAIFGLLLRFLCVTGRMSEASYKAADQELAAKACH